MLQLRRKITAVLAAVITYGAMVSPHVLAVTQNPVELKGTDASATLTGKKGLVFKRDFVDWTREAWGEPATATVNDKLHEGMQIGTGSESWAEVTWPNVKTRAWANTVFAVAPNKRLVYLTGGEMLFRLDKNRKDKDQAYYIWTKVLQARIRGTTVLVQAKGSVTRFSVMEGTVDIFNRLDHSRVTIKPGVVYEIRGYNVAPIKGSSYKPAPMSPPKDFDSSINDITYDSKSYKPIFQDSQSSSNVYTANSQALLNHPLVSANGNIDSLGLIQNEQRDIPGFNPMLPIKIADAARLNKVVTSAVAIKAVPSNCDYWIGQTVSKGLALPKAAQMDLAPKGVVLDPPQIGARQSVAVQAPSVAPPPLVPMFAPLPISDTAAATANGAIDESQAAAEVFKDFQKPLPTVDFRAEAPSPEAIATPGVVPQFCPSPAAATMGAFQQAAGSSMAPMFTSNSTVMPNASVAPVMNPNMPGVLTPQSVNVPNSASMKVAPPTLAPTQQVPGGGNGLLNNGLNGINNGINGITNILNK